MKSKNSSTTKKAKVKEEVPSPLNIDVNAKTLGDRTMPEESVYTKSVSEAKVRADSFIQSVAGTLSTQLKEFASSEIRKFIRLHSRFRCMPLTAFVINKLVVEDLVICISPSNQFHPNKQRRIMRILSVWNGSLHFYKLDEPRVEFYKGLSCAIDALTGPDAAGHLKQQLSVPHATTANCWILEFESDYIAIQLKEQSIERDTLEKAILDEAQLLILNLIKK